MMSSKMEKFIMVVILWMSGDRILTAAFPQWVSEQDTSLQISMVNDTDCTVGITGISAASNSSQTIRYSTNDANFNVNIDLNTLTYKLYCSYTALMMLSDTSHTVVVKASDPGGTITRTFTLTLIDIYAPVFGLNEVSITNCDLSSFSVGDVLYTVNVSDADPGDVVTIVITSTGTPFSVSEQTHITIRDVPALIEFFGHINFPYTLDVRAEDYQSKHTTDGALQVMYTSGEDCWGTSGSTGGGTTISSTSRTTGSTSCFNGTSGDCSGVIVFTLCVMIFITRFLNTLY